MLSGAVVGFLLLSDVFMVCVVRCYANNFLDWQWCVFAGTVAGMLGGVAIDLAWRFVEAPRQRYSLKELLMLVTLLAFSFGGLAALIRWAAK